MNDKPSHDCGLWCNQPECIRAQRDEYRTRLERGHFNPFIFESQEKLIHFWRDKYERVLSLLPNEVRTLLAVEERINKLEEQIKALKGNN